MTTNHPGNRPIRPVFVLNLNGAIIAIFSGGQHWAPFLVLGPVSAFESYGGAAAWGVIMAGYGVGAVVGGLALLGRRPGRPLVVAIGCTVLFATPGACLWLALPVWLVTAGAAGAGVASAVFNTLWATTVQQQVPREALSRINSYILLGAYAVGPVGLAAEGPVAEATGIGTALVAGVIWQVLATAAVLAIPSVRAVRQPRERPLGAAD